MISSDELFRSMTLEAQRESVARRRATGQHIPYIENPERRRALGVSDDEMAPPLVGEPNPDRGYAPPVSDEIRQRALKMKEEMLAIFLRQQAERAVKADMNSKGEVD